MIYLRMFFSITFPPYVQSLFSVHQPLSDVLPAILLTPSVPARRSITPKAYARL